MLNCGFCGTELNKGYRTCPTCGANYRRPSILSMLFHLFVVTIVLGFVGQMIFALEATIRSYSNILGDVVGTILAFALPAAAIWYIVKRVFPRRWYRERLYRV